MGFNNVGWKYYLVIICWSAFFIPGMFKIFDAAHWGITRPITLTISIVIYFFWPETARLTLEEIAQNFGEEVAVKLTDATDEEKAKIDRQIAHPDGVLPQSESSCSLRDVEKDSEGVTTTGQNDA